MRPVVVGVLLIAFAGCLLASLLLLQRGGTLGLWIFGGALFFAVLAMVALFAGSSAPREDQKNWQPVFNPPA